MVNLQAEDQIYRKKFWRQRSDQSCKAFDSRTRKANISSRCTPQAHARPSTPNVGRYSFTVPTIEISPLRPSFPVSASRPTADNMSLSHRPPFPGTSSRKQKPDVGLIALKSGMIIPITTIGRTSLTPKTESEPALPPGAPVLFARGGV